MNSRPISQPLILEGVSPEKHHLRTSSLEKILIKQTFSRTGTSFASVTGRKYKPIKRKMNFFADQSTSTLYFLNKEEDKENEKKFGQDFEKMIEKCEKLKINNESKEIIENCKDLYKLITDLSLSSSFLLLFHEKLLNILKNHFKLCRLSKSLQKTQPSKQKSEKMIDCCLIPFKNPASSQQSTLDQLKRNFTIEKLQLQEKISTLEDYIKNISQLAESKTAEMQLEKVKNFEVLKANFSEEFEKILKTKERHILRIEFQSSELKKTILDLKNENNQLRTKKKEYKIIKEKYEKMNKETHEQLLQKNEQV